MTDLSHPCSEKTRKDLEWSRITEALAERCRGPLGRALARALPFLSSREEVVTRLGEAEEATRLATRGEPLSIEEVPDVTMALERLRVSGALAADELCALQKALAAARALRRALHARRFEYPRLHAACSTDPALDDVENELTRCFEADGSLADRASQRLSELRSEFRAARQRILSRLEDLMARHESVLQDGFVTEREGRYVLPVRSDSHERFPGIVHATSGSGSTLFVEPRVVVAMGNRLKVLEADVAREEALILARLSNALEAVLPSLLSVADALAHADLCAAIARLAEELALSFPKLSETPILDLKDARHPLLALDALPRGERGTVTIVASDLEAKPGRAVIVSGPNAGGKTVALKTLGLAALMIRAGLPVACAPESHVGLFDVVLTDVGDDQSVSHNLSTFSAHVRNLAFILEETRPGALVLLDELAGGTDPREGEALAAGVLDSLCARGGAVMATTHYEGLKALALADDRFDNASVGFDLTTMTPTFRLALGVPGSSSALAVASRFGMPSGVIERATRFLTREEHDFEKLVQTLNRERAALALAKEAAETREREAKERATELTAAIAAAKDREARVLSQEAEAMAARLRRAKDELRAAEARLRDKSVDAAGLREASRAIDRVAGEIAMGGALEPLIRPDTDTPRERVSEDSLRRGARVFVAKLRAEAEVLEVTAGGHVRVAVGAMKLSVPMSELRAVEAVPKVALPAHGKRGRGGEAAPIALETPMQTSESTCDLRGLRADDAVAMATAFLDRSVSEGRRVAFLIHGHGTGSLRTAIRKELGESPYVAKLRAGESGEGGDGVTVVWMT